MIKDTTIRLLAPWAGRPAGAIIPGLALIVADALVRVRRIAEWAPGKAAEGAPLGQAPPANAAPSKPAEDLKPRRRPR